MAHLTRLMLPGALLLLTVFTPEDGFEVRWSRLSEQIFRFDKWSVCRG